MLIVLTNSNCDAHYVSVAWGLRNIMLFQPCSILTDITKSKSSDDLAKLVLNRSQLHFGAENELIMNDCSWHLAKLRQKERIADINVHFSITEY